MCEEKQTVKLTLEDSFGNKSIMEHTDTDILAYDIVNMFYSALLGLTYQESAILDAMLDFAADKRNTQYVEAKAGDDYINPDELSYACFDPHIDVVVNNNSNPLGIKYSSSVTNEELCPHSIKR